MEQIIIDNDKLRCLMEVVRSLKLQVSQLEGIIREMRLKQCSIK